MRSRSALLPFAVAAGLFAASPAMAAQHGAPAHISGGDPPPVVPSLIQTRITRTENALERLTKYVDNNQAAKVTTVGKVIRRQTAAAWRGAKYYLRTAPPPATEDRFVPRSKSVRSLKGDLVGPVVADQYASAVAVFGLAHDVAAEAVELTDGAHGTNLSALSQTMFWTLDKRDQMVKDAEAFEPPPAEDARVKGGSRQFKGTEAGAGFAALMPTVTQGLDDEIQHINGLTSDATDLDVRGRSILGKALAQVTATEAAINAFWPPVPADD